MAFDDLIWKIWEIEEEIREKQQEAEELKQRLRELGISGKLETAVSNNVLSTFISVGDIHTDIILEYTEDIKSGKLSQTHGKK